MEWKETMELDCLGPFNFSFIIANIPNLGALSADDGVGF